MLSPLQQLRRKVAMILLCIAAGMLIWGTLVWNEHLHGAVGMVYWILCTLASVTGAAIALREAIYSIGLMRLKRNLSHQSLEHSLKRLQTPTQHHVVLPNQGTEPNWIKNN